MSDSYLDLARTILAARGMPLSAMDILAEARKYGVLPEHLHGRTMHKTLQARISEDIVSKRFRSSFYRTGPATFFLRDMAAGARIHESSWVEYIGTPRQKSLQRQRVLSLQISKSAGGVLSCPLVWLVDEMSSERAVYLHRQAAQERADTFMVMTFSIIKKGNDIVCHRPGRFSEFSEFKDKETAGFRSYISEFDIDLLNDDVVGVRRNSARELYRHISFQDKPLTDYEMFSRMDVCRSLIDFDRKLCAFVVFFDGSGLEFRLRMKAKALDINQARWVSLDGVNYFDSWSQAAIGDLA